MLKVEIVKRKTDDGINSICAGRNPRSANEQLKSGWNMQRSTKPMPGSTCAYVHLGRNKVVQVVSDYLSGSHASKSSCVTRSPA